jgi:hypothetical protein
MLDHQFRQSPINRNSYYGNSHVLKTVLQIYGQFDASQIAIPAPLDYLIPLIGFMERYFLHEMTKLRLGHRNWVQKTEKMATAEMAPYDDLLSSGWRDFRATLEGF